MKNTINKFVVIGLVTVIGLLIAGCGSGRPNGAYVAVDGSSITFSDDKVTLEYGSMKMEGTWEIKDGKMFYTFHGITSPGQDYKISGKKIIIGEIEAVKK